MIVNPRIGQRVQIWYRAGLRDAMPLHGRVGGVEVRSRGRPRNHGGRVGGVLYVVPCGNLRVPGANKSTPAGAGVQGAAEDGQSGQALAVN